MKRPESDPEFESGPGGRSNGVATRLGIVVAIVAVVFGFGLGRATTKTKNDAASPLVTAEQIRAAAAAAGAHTVANDRGFAKLENGIQHSHGFEAALTPAQRAVFIHQMTLAQQVALQFPTLQDAVNAGMRRAGPFSPGLGTHMINFGKIHYIGTSPMSDDDIRHPIAWIYDGTKPTSPVAGLFYQAGTGNQNPAGFAGANDIWHHHTNICITFKGGHIDAPLGADHGATTAQCNAVGGTLIKSTGPLLHVWVVPGYEDSLGVFSHLNPAITCNDGSYKTIPDVTKIGSRATVCADGTE
jgi:hypothetical protein